MNVIEAIHARRAVRTYTSRVVDEATVRSLLHAAVQAPTAMHAEPWIFSVVQSTSQLARWSDRAKAMLLDQAMADPKTHHYRPLLGDPHFNIFYDASTLVVIGSKERGTYSDADCWLAAENLMLAARELGLGSCPIGFAVGVLNTSDAKRTMQFPDSAVVVAPILLGYPSAPAPEVPRAEPKILSWIR